VPREARAAWALALSLLAGPRAGAAVQRDLDLAAPGRVVLTLDRDVYERARPDLADLRIFDEAGREVPYLLERALDDARTELRRPAVRDRAFVRGQRATVTLDFGASTLKDHLVLALSGDNFRRRVVVEGRHRQEPEWETLTDTAYVFAVPGDAPMRYETVPLPENNHRLLRVTVHHGDDDPERIEILDAWVRPETRRRPREIAVAPRVRPVEHPQERETHFVIDLGARHQPFRALVLDVKDPRFFRSVVVEARVESAGASAAPLTWRYLSEGALYRYEEDGEVREALRIEAAGRERMLRVRIRNRDDRPLDAPGVTVMVPVERLVFDAAEGRRYRLAYGQPDRGAPTYDLARTAGDASLYAARARPARLLEPVPIVAAPPRVPWTERHPVLLWAGLVAVAGALGGLTWRALQRT
jgi:hypothetical protein